MTLDTYATLLTQRRLTLECVPSNRNRIRYELSTALVEQRTGQVSDDVRLAAKMHMPFGDAEFAPK